MLQQNISQNLQQLLSDGQGQSLQILAYTNHELDSFLTGRQEKRYDISEDRHVGAAFDDRQEKMV
ncbi:MAG: hypothetical protein Q4F43_05635 [Eubacteriales bacterium]|nr:hypothetical protein [Eubacteriales bacterium]